jgi:hypothetical protein
VRLRRYPAWQLSLNGQKVSAMPHRQDGLMAVAVPRGPFELNVDWTTTPDVIVGRLVSLASIAFIAVVWLRERRRVRARL